MLLRTLLMMVRSRRKPPVDFREVGRVWMRVMPNDLDILRHVNNGIYLSLMDLGRMDLFIRSGQWKALQHRGWYSVAASVTVTYRRSLRLWQKYELQTKVVGFDNKAMYIQQRFVRDNEVYVEGLMKGRFLKTTGGTVTIAELGEMAGVDPATMPIPDWMASWSKDAALPAAKANFPSDWI
jgi:acyl-CoA thioesterase FadM